MQSTVSTSAGSVNTSFPLKWNNAVLSAVFGMLVGTGGVANARMIHSAPTGPIVVRIVQVSDRTADPDRLLDVQEKLAGIRRYLSMNITDMARVLRVGRPSIYSWLRDEARLRTAHWQRLEMIYKSAREWRKISDRPIGERLHRPLASGVTLLDLLSSRTLDESEISVGFSQIQEMLGRTQRPSSILDVAKKRGLKLTAKRAKTWTSNEELDL